MRVTQIQLQELALSSVTDTRARVQEKQKIAATGQRVTIPEDDPAGAARARLLNSLLEESESYIKNIDFGRLRLQQAEDALSEAGNIFVRAKELAYAMATDSVSPDQRELAAGEIDELRNSLIDLANTKQGDEFIFAHINTRTAPVDASGAFTYDVDLYSNVRRVETGPNTTGEIGASASFAFAQRAADPDSVNVFDVLEQLATDLRSNDSDAIRANIDQLEAGFSQVVAERAQIGIRSNRLDNAAATATQAIDLYRQLEADIVDADAAEAFSSLSLAQTGLQAAISVSARMLGPSLLDSI